MGEKSEEPTVLGINGSPVDINNTYGPVKTIIEATGAEQEFVKLSDIEAACKKCVYTNSMCRMTL